MDVIANDLGRFDPDIENFKGDEKGLNKNFESLVEHVTTLNTMWDGAAYNTFINRFNRDKEEAQNLINQLENVYNNLRFAYTEYSDCENSVASVIDEMNV
ncbi:WXG100 family type VII secretion target [Pseudobutyrivibrio sp.]|uniref:WXG100 family type VII secretion target n=1 Tax=Pseudobutyrivibrio sp. TaxID=2014367 RepID=UPI001E15206D|nr:WXG100 family type VII secretion target [Pseudobutyrivibrio sp.]MBE5912016.1 hypothetical protein [Pseudobutyrivibrio sp.]